DFGRRLHFERPRHAQPNPTATGPAVCRRTRTQSICRRPRFDFFLVGTVPTRLCPLVQQRTLDQTFEVRPATRTSTLVDPVFVHHRLQNHRLGQSVGHGGPVAPTLRSLRRSQAGRLRRVQFHRRPSGLVENYHSPRSGCGVLLHGSRLRAVHPPTRRPLLGLVEFVQHGFGRHRPAGTLELGHGPDVGRLGTDEHRLDGRLHHPHGLPLPPSPRTVLDEAHVGVVRRGRLAVDRRRPVHFVGHVVVGVRLVPRGVGFFANRPAGGHFGSFSLVDRFAGFVHADPLAGETVHCILACK
ncbi:conserved hypothetical protein, partial [Trichinella spiralis]|uniref:hypothetical protein n=1 Tax=Trichinella spiralis TaxID=6334 RepID=UPI0001EFD601